MEIKNILSLFDGGSCGQLAAKRAGVNYENYFASEIDKHAIFVTQKNFPSTKQLGDVRNVKPSNMPPIDMLIGGSPCQSLTRQSNEGFAGKSGLFWEFIRVWNEVKKQNTNAVFMLENVLMRKEWEKIITDALGVEPILINSSIVSAQKRPRLYWTNIKNVIVPENKNITLRDVYIGDGEIVDSFGKEFVNVDNEPFVWNDGRDWCVRNATKKGFLNVKNYDSVNLDFPKSKTRRGRVGIQKANTLNTGCNQGIFVDGIIRKLSPIECERLQTLPDNWTKGVSINQRKKICGNGWTVDVIVPFFKAALKS
jgi:DNA-cytosine methyltransferase